MGLLDKEWIVVWDESPTPMADLVRLLCFFLAHFAIPPWPRLFFVMVVVQRRFFLLDEAGHVAKPFGDLEVIEQGLRVSTSRKT